MSLGSLDVESWKNFLLPTGTNKTANDGANIVFRDYQ
jgi:hypothetical protein